MSEIHDLLVLPYLNHAVRMYEADYASRADVDAAMRFGCGYPEGPLTVIDRIGLDVVRDRLAARFEQTGDRLHQPADLLEKLVAEGRTGVEAGRGFYTYADGAVAGMTGVVLDVTETRGGDLRVTSIEARHRAGEMDLVRAARVWRRRGVEWRHGEGRYDRITWTWNTWESFRPDSGRERGDRR